MPEVRLHPNTDVLLEFAAGSLSPAQAVAVSAHLFYCPHCQAKSGTLDAIGGNLLADSEAVSVSVDCRSDVMAQLDTVGTASPEKLEINDAAPQGVRWKNLPPLVNRLFRESGISWRHLSSSLRVARLPVGERRFELALHQIKAGGSAPAHDHRGLEITVVLHGSFSDDEGVYHQGDYITREPGHVHTPVATANTECICLSVLEAPIRLVGRFSRLLNPFMSFMPV